MPEIKKADLDDVEDYDKLRELVFASEEDEEKPTKKGKKRVNSDSSASDDIDAW